MINGKTWFRIHSFTGVITGLLLFVICWSGTFAVVSNEMDWLVTPQVRVNPAHGGQPDWLSMMDSVKAAYLDAEIVWFEAPLYPVSAAQFVVNKPGQEWTRVYVDPYTNEVQGESSYYTIQRFFRSFHIYLFVPVWGEYIVMILSLTLLASAIASLLFYRRRWNRFFRFKQGKTAFWSELHKTGGLWSLWFILVIGVTGAWYLFELSRFHIGDGIIAYTGGAEYSVHTLPEPSSEPSLPRVPLHSILEKIREVRPDMDIRTVEFDMLDGAVYVDGQAGHWLVRDSANQVYVDARTGRVLYNQRADEYPLYWRWSDTADPLHFGDFAGLTSKLIWFLFGLVLCGLILTGTWLHVRRLSRSREGYMRNRWPGTIAAMIVSIIILGASVPAGFHEASEYYGREVDGEKLLPELLTGVSAVISGWIVVTLVIIGIWVALLWRPVAFIKNDRGVYRSFEQTPAG